MNEAELAHEVADITMDVERPFAWVNADVDEGRRVVLDLTESCTESEDPDASKERSVCMTVRNEIELESPQRMRCLTAPRTRTSRGNRV